MKLIYLLLSVVAFAIATATVADAAALPYSTHRRNRDSHPVVKPLSPMNPPSAYPPLPPLNSSSIYYYPTSWITTAIPIIFNIDTVVQIRMVAMIGLAWYEAISAYDPVAIGPAVNGELRRPTSEGTALNKNIALSYATYAVAQDLLPSSSAAWRNLMANVLNLNPDDSTTDPSTPVGLGKAIGKKVIEWAHTDGFNQLGDMPNGITANPRNYSDYTGYTPVNDAYHLRDWTRWQPQLVQPDNVGSMVEQAHNTPHAGQARTFGFRDKEMFQIPAPIDSLDPDSEGYRQQALDLIDISAQLNDQQKMSAEYFNSKIIALGLPLFYLAQKHNFTLEQFIRYDYITSMALRDAGILVWNFKRRFDAVRPVTVINNLFRDEMIRAYAGPGQGTRYILGKDWTSYLNTQAHSEYPSGTTCFCAAYAGAASTTLGTDQFGFSMPFPKGSSRFEPGITPAQDVLLGPFETFHDYLNLCSQTRTWAGVHFQLATMTPKSPCYQAGQLVANRAKAMIQGNDIYFDNFAANDDEGHGSGHGSGHGHH